MNFYSSEPMAAAPTGGSNERRRSEPRACTVYRPCGLRLDSQYGVGLVRNVSANGLMVETRFDARPGQDLEYCWQGSDWRPVRAVWCEGGRIGLEKLACTDAEPPRSYPYRALRVPMALPARLWLGEGRPVDVAVDNVSRFGVQIFGAPAMERGRLVTLTMNGVDRPECSARWWNDGASGIRFAEPISLAELAELVELASRRAVATRFEQQIVRMLEVVPANDAVLVDT